MVPYQRWHAGLQLLETRMLWRWDLARIYFEWHKNNFDKTLVTVELSCCFYPPASQLESLWQQNRKSMIDYLKLANTGVRGIVRFENGQAAAHIGVQIDSIEPIFKTNNHGEYYRLLLPGSYSLRILLNCTSIYTTQFSVAEKTLLTELNITLNASARVKYNSSKKTLDNHAIFCRESWPYLNCDQSSRASKIKNINSVVLFSSVLLCLAFMITQAQTDIFF